MHESKQQHAPSKSISLFTIITEKLFFLFPMQFIMKEKIYTTSIMDDDDVTKFILLYCSDQSVYFGELFRKYSHANAKSLAVVFNPSSQHISQSKT